MHFVLCWNIKVAGERAKEVEASLAAVIKPYSWVRALDSFYIVKVDTQEKHDAIREALVAIAKTSPKDFYFVMSPLATGRYRGWLPQSLWAKIEEKSS
jgi:hypothetical protein